MASRRPGRNGRSFKRIGTRRGSKSQPGTSSSECFLFCIARDKKFHSRLLAFVRLHGIDELVRSLCVYKLIHFSAFRRANLAPLGSVPREERASVLRYAGRPRRFALEHREPDGDKKNQVFSFPSGFVVSIQTFFSSIRDLSILRTSQGRIELFQLLKGFDG